MVKLFNQVRNWCDGKKAYTALVMAAFAPAQELFRDIHQHIPFFQMLASPEWNSFMLALGAIFIRMGISKVDMKVEQVAGEATEQNAANKV